MESKSINESEYDAQLFGFTVEDFMTACKYPCVTERSTIHESEYDAQLFGFTVEDFMTAFKCLFEDEVSRLTSSMASSFIKKYPDGDPEIGLIKEIRKALIKQYIARAEEPLNTLNSQLKALMHIPPHVLLPEDAVQRTQYSAEEEQEIDDQLKDLFQRLKRTKAFKVELQQELKMLQDVLPDLNKRVEELEKAVAEQRENEEVLERIEPAIQTIADNTKELLTLDDVQSD